MCRFLVCVSCVVSLFALLGCSKSSSPPRSAEGSTPTNAQEGSPKPKAEGDTPTRLQRERTVGGLLYTTTLEAKKGPQGHIMHVMIRVSVPKEGSSMSVSRAYTGGGPIDISGTILETRSSRMRWSTLGDGPFSGSPFDKLRVGESKTFERAFPSTKPDGFDRVIQPIRPGETFSVVVRFNGARLNASGAQYQVRLMHASLRISPDGVVTLESSPMEEHDTLVPIQAAHEGATTDDARAETKP